MQLTLQQSLFRGSKTLHRVPIKRKDDNQPGPSGDERHTPQPVSSEPETAISADSSDSDHFSEPDPDSSDEWLPSGPTGSSRDSSPDDKRKNEEGNVTLLDHVVHQTNLYASQYFQAHPDLPQHSRGNAWKPVSVSELKTFFGLTFLTGYVKKPSTEMYWSVDEVDATPYFSKTMSRNRFQIIWKFLHYNDNANLDVNDKMYKVRPVLDYIVEKFKQMYQPDKNICIDEGMMLWRGRLSFRVYNPQKPVKYGIKSYILCDSATGYCFNMRPYFGEGSSLPDTVFSLLDRLSGHGYTLYMDNFYNSVALCERLLEAQTNVCGTLRKNRGEPQVIRDLVKTDLGIGDKVVRHNDKVMVVAWQDKRLVKMVTTCHQDGMQKVDVWQKGHKDKVAQFKPECVVAYNSHMNGVDKLDQNISYYPFIRRSLNWSKKFVAYLFQMCMFNAYILYRARNPGGCNTLLKFIRSVVKSWTLKVHERKGSEVGEQIACLQMKLLPLTKMIIYCYTFVNKHQISCQKPFYSLVLLFLHKVTAFGVSEV
uniref:PiggyBac transposable element-derived protein domain-containing protein n=1 Tax=Nothobranchius furzeri TaxID=105023 RepID=A0A8C6NXJ7_NOTFU